MIRRLLPLSALALLPPLAAGCAAWREPDLASGHWDGAWYVSKMPKPGGALRCDVERVDKREWKAVFDAEFGGRGIYHVELRGERAGEKVAFGGEVDLGAANGGVYQWTGEADGKVFAGKYTSKMFGGTFEMKRSSEKPSAPQPTPAPAEPNK